MRQAIIAVLLTGCGAPMATQLEGTWLAQRYTVEDRVIELVPSEPRWILHSDSLTSGPLSISVSCNYLQGYWRRLNNQIEIRPGGSTLIECSNAETRGFDELIARPPGDDPASWIAIDVSATANSLLITRGRVAATFSKLIEP